MLKKRTAVFFILILGQLFGCAFMKRENRIITNQMDELINPESTGAKIALAPLAVPLGTVTLLSDTFIIHPIRVLPKSAEKTWELFWQNSEGGIILQTFLFFPKLILTPVGFVFIWLSYSIFDI